jgi:hypothetical protein
VGFFWVVPPVTLKDLSFVVTYDDTSSPSWVASARELPAALNIEARSDTPAMALELLAISCNDLLRTIQGLPSHAPTRPSLSWSQLLSEAQLTPEGVLACVRSGGDLRPQELTTTARQLFHRHHHFSLDYEDPKEVLVSTSDDEAEEVVENRVDDAGRVREIEKVITVNHTERVAYEYPRLRGLCDLEDRYERELAYFTDGLKRGVALGLRQP